MSESNNDKKSRSSEFEFNAIHEKNTEDTVGITPAGADKIIKIKNIEVKLEDEENEKDISFRRGKHKDGTLLRKIRKSIARLEESNHGGLNHITKKIKEDEEDEELKKEIIRFKYATDISYRHNDETTTEKIWEAIVRREAWAQKPLHMIGVTIAQIVISLIVVLSNNSPINSSTVLMAVLFICGIAASNKFNVTRDLYKILMKLELEKKIPFFVIVLLSPIIAIVLSALFGTTFALDLLVGEIVDLSYGGLINNMINVFVVFSAISVGLRSGNPVNAIQTFAGFDFVSNLDEMVMDSINVDMHAMTSSVHSEGKKRKIQTVRILSYILIPLLAGFFFYITVVNTCLVFCSY